MIHKRVLTKVSHHKTSSKQQQGEKEDDKSSFWVESVQKNECCVVAQLPESSLQGKTKLSRSDKVTGQVEPDEKVESSNVV